MAFERIAALIDAPAGAAILDAGCGSGHQTERLARRGFNVTGIDFSETILQSARNYLRKKGTVATVCLHREDLLATSFSDATFNTVICWGVLMHIYEVELAIKEAARLIQPGGRFVISEGNMHSVQAMTFQLLRRILGRGDAVTERTEVGVEYWNKTESGKLLTRESDLPRLTKIVERHGFKLEHRIAGQFTEAYTRFSPGIFRSGIQCFNRFWFKYIGWARPAFGNILIFQRVD